MLLPLSKQVKKPQERQQKQNEVYKYRTYAFQLKKKKLHYLHKTDFQVTCKNGIEKVQVFLEIQISITVCCQPKKYTFTIILSHTYLSLIPVKMHLYD